MSAPTTTLFPVANLPACVSSCGPLFDANGACVPPNIPSVDNNCFCDYNALSPWHQGASGVCVDAPCSPDEFSSLQSWYTSYCSSATAAGADAGNGGTTTTTNTGGATTPTGTRSSANQGPGGDWISNHWRWVIGIVILVVAIVGIWIGACIWRRRYLRRKDRAKGFGKHTSQSAFPAPGGSTVHVGAPGSGAPPTAGNGANPAGPGMFMPNSTSTFEEKPKKKWIVRDRT